MGMLEAKNIGKDTNYWLIRPGINNICFEQFKRDSVVAIGWDRIGNINSDTIVELEKIKYIVAHEYADLLQEKKGTRERRRKISDIASKIYRFLYEIKIGDIVICPGNDSVLIGKIQGKVYISDGKYKVSDSKDSDEYIGNLNKVRKVEWINEIKRENLEPNIKLELRVVHGLSQINRMQVISEINRAIYSFYTYNNETHSIYRIKNQEDIEFVKYAKFIECINAVYKRIGETDQISEHNLYIKSNINSPGPIDIFGTPDLVYRITERVEIILKKGNIENASESDENWISEMQDKYNDNYDDYVFPSGGSV